MGGHNYSTYVSNPDTSPNFNKAATFDSNYGFENGRKERKMMVTEEEMNSASLTKDQRDYCAHKVIEFLKCRHDMYPWVSRCSHEKHEFDQCQNDDYMHRMKEYERERRLLERAKRKGVLE